MITALEPADVRYAIWRKSEFGETNKDVALDLDCNPHTVASAIKQYAKYGLAAFSINLIADEIYEMTRDMTTSQAYEHLTKLGFKYSSPSTMRRAFARAGIELKFDPISQHIRFMKRDENGRVVCQNTNG